MSTIQPSIFFTVVHDKYPHFSLFMMLGSMQTVLFSLFGSKTRLIPWNFFSRFCAIGAPPPCTKMKKFPCRFRINIEGPDGQGA